MSLRSAAILFVISLVVAIAISIASRPAKKEIRGERPESSHVQYGF